MAQSRMDLRYQRRAIPHNHHSWTQNKMGDASLAPALPQKTTPLRAACQLQTADAWGAYRKLRNRCNAVHEKEKIYKQYFAHQHEKLEQEIDGSRHWWSRAKCLSRVASPHSGLPALKCKSACTVEDAASKADILADFFFCIAMHSTEPSYL